MPLAFTVQRSTRTFPPVTSAKRRSRVTEQVIQPWLHLWPLCFQD
jgi:hypothetical protein